MSSKITIIGAGSVGATIAYTLSSQDIASELVLIDINKKKAEGEVLDIIQGTCFRDPISIIAGDYEDAKDSDIVIITSGIARKPGQTRLELTQTNVNILKSITPEIVKAAPNALYLIVSNPVDIMTYVFTKISGLPENQILGSGTILDSARLRCGLSEHFQIAQSNIHAYVFGEHGDTSFIPWSGAYISGVSVDEYYDLEKKLGAAEKSAADLSEAKQSLAAEKGRNSDLEKKLAAAEKGSEELSGVKKALEAEQGKTADLERRLDASRKAADDAQNSVSVLEKDIAALKSENEELSALREKAGMYEELTVKFSQIENENAALRAGAGSDASEGAAPAQMEELKKQLSDALAEVKELRKINASLNRQLNEMLEDGQLTL